MADFNVVAPVLLVAGTFLFGRDDGLVHYAACWDAFAPPENSVETTGRQVPIAGTHR